MTDKLPSYNVRSYEDQREHNRQYRDALGAYPTGVAIVCGRGGDGHPQGLTINSFASVSLDPPLVLWSLASTSESLAAFEKGKPFSLTILSEGQENLAQLFASEGADRFADTPTQDGVNGVPIIDGGSAFFECSTFAVHDGGDHKIIVGQVTRFGESGASSLLYHKGMFRPL